jgi:hypothetical protein
MKDLLTGILFVSIGLLFNLYSRIYELGTASNMGPGYYPGLISILLTLLGIFLIIKNFIKK